MKKHTAKAKIIHLLRQCITESEKLNKIIDDMHDKLQKGREIK